MLSRPIGPCIRKNRWTAGILSMLQLVRIDVEQPWLSVGSWCSDLMLEKNSLLTDGQGKLVESDSPSTCLSTQIFLAWLQTKLSKKHLRRYLIHWLGSFAKSYCKGFCGFWFWILQHPTCLSHCHLILPWCRSLLYHSFRMFEVVQKVLTMPPTAKSASLGFITWLAKIRKLPTYHEVSVVCKLKALHNVPSSRIHSSNYCKA